MSCRIWSYFSSIACDKGPPSFASVSVPLLQVVHCLGAVVLFVVGQFRVGNTKLRRSGVIRVDGEFAAESQRTNGGSILIARSMRNERFIRDGHRVFAGPAFLANHEIVFANRSAGGEADILYDLVSHLRGSQALGRF